MTTEIRRNCVTKRQLATAIAVAITFCASAAHAQPVHDGFYWIGEMNKASAVMVVDTKIVDRSLGSSIAEAVAKVIKDGEQPGAIRSDDYLRVEPLGAVAICVGIGLSSSLR